MKKLFFLFCISMLLLSCSKDLDYPSEFEKAVGIWDAYEYFTWSDNNTYYNQFTMDSIENDFSVQISKARISVYNSGTKSSDFSIKSVDIISQNDSLITFNLNVYSCIPFCQKTQGIIYHSINDEIVLYSHDTNSIDGKGYSYLLKRR